MNDRKEKQPELESIDVLMLTLDEETFIERCLHSIYREIPVRRLIVCDGGSKDNTIEVLKNFPRVELHVRPDIRTTAKILEFLFPLFYSLLYSLLIFNLFVSFLF